MEDDTFGASKAFVEFGIGRYHAGALANNGVEEGAGDAKVVFFVVAGASAFDALGDGFALRVEQEDDAAISGYNAKCFFEDQIEKFVEIEFHADLAIEHVGDAEFFVVFADLIRVEDLFFGEEVFVDVAGYLGDVGLGRVDIGDDGDLSASGLFAFAEKESAFGHGVHGFGVCVVEVGDRADVEAQGDRSKANFGAIGQDGICDLLIVDEGSVSAFEIRHFVVAVFQRDTGMIFGDHAVEDLDGVVGVSTDGVVGSETVLLGASVFEGHGQIGLGEGIGRIALRTINNTFWALGGVYLKEVMATEAGKSHPVRIPQSLSKGQASNEKVKPFARALMYSNITGALAALLSILRGCAGVSTDDGGGCWVR